MPRSIPFLLLWAAVILAAGTQCSRREENSVSPRTVDGTLDLRGWNFTKDGPVRLTGPWEIRWSRINDPENAGWSDTGEVAMVTAPHLWKNGPSPDFPKTGIASYRLYVELDSLSFQPGLDFHQTPAAYHIFVNGRLIKKVGRIGRTADLHEERYVPAVFAAPLVPGRNEILVTLASNPHPCAGLGTLTLGALSQLSRSFMIDLFLRLIVVGCLLFMMALAMVLFAGNPGQMQFCWFSGFCLCAAIASTGLFGVNVFATLHEPWSPAFIYAREAGIHGSVIMLIGFLSALYPRELSLRLLSPVLAANALIILLTLWYGSNIVATTAGSNLFTIILLATIPAMLVPMIFAVKARRKYARAILISFLPLGLCALYDMYSAINTNTFNVSHLGLLVLTLGYGYIIAKELSENARLVARQKVELSHAEKLATIGTLTASVAHEINNPNNALTLTLKSQQRAWEAIEPMLDGYARDNGEFEVGGYSWKELREELRRSFSRASGNAARIGAIVRQLREFSRRDDGSYGEWVDLNAVVADSLILTENLVRKRTANLRMELAPDLPPIRGNHQRLEQVVINVLQNAAQALESFEKAITITTRHEPASQRVTMVIADEGAGMDAMTLRHVFDPFFTTKAAREGTGLGLAICKRIVEAHGAAIAVDSKPGAGTVVSIHFPL